jgi:hypothetical protein
MAKLIPLPITPPPGVVLTETSRVAEGRYIASRNVRFVKGRPQKLGGNLVATTEPTSGQPRTSHAWRDNVQNNYLAVGTYRKLYIYDTVWARNDITPFRDEGTLGNDPFTTTNGSAVVLVADTSHGVNPGDTVILDDATAVGGITPNGTFPVDTVPDADSYTFIFTSAATSDATGGGAAVTYQYEIPIGVELGTYGYGYGVGGYGLGTYGTARDESTIFIEPRIWSLDHFGKLLMGAYNGGSIYLLDPTDAQPWGRATLISVDAGLPTNVRAMFVTPERFIFALLADMQVHWCTQGDYAVWTPATGNTANIRTLTEGTKLVSGRVLSDFISLVWTDAALYRFQYTGSTYVYNSSMVAKDCGLLSPNGAVTIAGVAYWIGQDTFWMYVGSVVPMPNVEDIRKYIFDLIDIDSGYQCNATYWPQHNEVVFFVTVEGEETPTIGALYSIENQCWAPLDFGRVSGTHFTQGDTRPYMAKSDGLIYQHEIGWDDDGVEMPWSLTLAPYAMSEGGVHMDVEHVIPDFKDQVGIITMTLDSYDYLNDSTFEDSETDTIAAVDSGSIDMRVSGRYIGMTLSCSSLGCYFRMGKPVAWIKPSGNR